MALWKEQIRNISINTRIIDPAGCIKCSDAQIEAEKYIFNINHEEDKP